jgi:hypothetical protein
VADRAFDIQATTKSKYYDHIVLLYLESRRCRYRSINRWVLILNNRGDRWVLILNNRGDWWVLILNNRGDRWVLILNNRGESDVHI